LASGVARETDVKLVVAAPGKILLAKTTQPR
jgi:hypothetical protein